LQPWVIALVRAALAKQPEQPWGWALEDKNGDGFLTRPRLREFFGAANHEHEPLTLEDVASADKEWPGLAPFRLVTLHAKPSRT
jgi:hypothetical protein